MVLVLIQVSGDLSDTDLSGEAWHPRSSTDAAEDQGRDRLFKSATQVSEKETSSGEEPESEPRPESEAQKESLSSADNGQRVREELRKVSGRRARVGGSSVQRCTAPRERSRKALPACANARENLLD